MFRLMKEWAGVILLFFIFGCTPYLTSGQPKSPQADEGILRLYLNLYSATDEEISFQIKEMQLITEDGKSVIYPIDQKVRARARARQMLIEQNLPSGNYHRIGFLLAEPVAYSSEGTLALEYKEECFMIEVPVVISLQRVTDLSVNLEVSFQGKGGLNKSGFVFSPKMSRGKKATALKSLMAYVSNEADDTVTVIDRLTNSVVSVIPVGKQPKGVVVDQKGTYAYVANYGSNTISVIDTMTNEVEEPIDLPLGLGPSALAVSPDGRYLFTANTGSNNISVIDTDLKKVIETLEAGHQPFDVAVSPSGLCLYVTNNGSDDLHVFNLEKCLRGGARCRADLKIPMRSKPWGIALAKEDDLNYDRIPIDRVVVANAGASTLFSGLVEVGTLTTVLKESSILQGEYGPFGDRHHGRPNQVPVDLRAVRLPSQILGQRLQFLFGGLPLEPGPRGVVVVRAGVHDAIPDEVVREIGVFRVPAEGEEEDLHTR